MKNRRSNILRRLCMACAVMVFASCTTVRVTITDAERRLISESPDVMRVLKVSDRDDSMSLRIPSRNLNVADINSPEFKTLERKMIATLTDPKNDGVGIAAPQVGIRRRVIAVKRYDKKGKPIEIYINPWIFETVGERETGPEGCLSVPDRRGEVPRWRTITVCYTDSLSDRRDQPREVREKIEGYTAVIFQHEIDHLDGILYTDRLQ